jgi:hypothetical protein
LLYETLPKFLAWPKVGQCRRSCMRWNWYRYSNCSWRNLHPAVRATFWAVHVRRTVLYVSRHALFHTNCLWTSPSSKVYSRKAKTTSFLDAKISGVQCACFRKFTLAITPWVLSYSCPITTGLAEN